MLVHLAFGLLIASTFFHFLAAALKLPSVRERWMTVARWLLWLGCGLFVVTVAVGWLAYDAVSQAGGDYELTQTHRNLGVAAAAAYILLGVWSIRARRRVGQPSSLFILALAMAAGVLITAGLRGGQLVLDHELEVHVSTRR